MTETSGSTTDGPSIDARRHPAALAGAIGGAWRPYRIRAYAAAIVAGLVAGGVLAPILTTTLLLVAALNGTMLPQDVPWQEAVWTLTFALTLPFVGASAFAWWQPRRLRRASQTYLWLADRAEANWARAFGGRPVPRDERDMRAFLEAVPETPEGAAQRAGLMFALLDVEGARAAIAAMPNATPHDRFGRASAAWLADFVAGTTRPIEPLESLAHAIADPDERLEAVVALAVYRGRAALADGGDWETPLAAVRDDLGPSADALYRRIVWRPTFVRLLSAALVGLAVFWVGTRWLRPFLSVL